MINQKGGFLGTIASIALPLLAQILSKMKNAIKMVLIPEAEYRKLLPEGGIKAKISKIVSGKRNHESAQELSQLFCRYLRTTKPQPQIQLPKPSDNLQLLSHFQPIYHGKVSKVLAEFEKYGIRWTNRN